MKKLFTLAAAVLASLSLWAATYVRVDSIDFTNTTNFPAVTYTNQSATVHGVFFKAKSSKNVKVNNTTPGVDFDGTNLGSGDHGIAIPVTGVNGSLKVIVYHDYNNTSANHRVGVSHATGNDPSAAQTWDLTPTNSGGTKNKNEFILTKTDLAGTDYIVWVGESSSSYKVIKRVAIYTEAPECDEPAKPLVLSSDAAATVYVGDVVTFTTGDTGNGGAVTIAGANSETITDSKWTATEGEHTFTASQAKNGDFCAQESELKLTVKAKTPVTACSIEGPTAGYKGNKVTYTATAANATAYRWTVDGAIQAGAESATFEYTPAANGTYSIVGQARNDFNATSEWISSDPISLTVTSLYGEIIKATRNGKNLDPVTGLIGGTAEKNTQDAGKLGSDGHYWKLTLASGNFNVGDTVIVNVSTAAGQGVVAITSDKGATDVLGALDNFGVVGDNKVVLTKADVSTIWLSRVDAINKWNGVVDAISVVRPMPVKSVAESLTAVKVDGVAISSEDLATLLSSAYKVNLAAAYAAAPEVEFNKHVVKTFEDDSQDVSDVPVKVTAEKNGLGRWEAKTTINAIEYTVTAGVNASATIIYMDGEEKLGEEVVAINGNPAKYGDYQTKKLSTFKGWYSDKALTSAVTIASAVIDKDTTFYAKFENAYASSVNIEKLVLDNGTKYDLMGYMGGLNYATNIENSLDTLNDLEKKDNRNYAYLGLKVKAAGKLLDFRLADGATLKVKFGAYKAGSEPQVSINGAAYAAMGITDGVYSHTASGDELVSIKTATADAVVFKQIMIGEELKDVELPAPGAYLVTCAEAENGTVTAAWPNKKYRTPVGETVTLTVTPNDGYKVADVKVNGESLNAVEGVYSFPMPAQDVTVVATFSVVTAIDNTEAAVKATKVVRDGQLYIEKNGVLYNAQGAIVR